MVKPKFVLQLPPPSIPAVRKLQNHHYPAIPPRGIIDEWIEKVMKIDPHLEPTVERSIPGRFNIIFYKDVNGEQMPMFVGYNDTMENILERLSQQSEEFETFGPDGRFLQVKGIWGKHNIEQALVPVRGDVAVYYRRYTPQELETMSENELKYVAKIKAAAELSGGLFRWNREGTVYVKAKGKKLTAKQKRESLIGTIERNNSPRPDLRQIGANLGLQKTA